MIRAMSARRIALVIAAALPVVVNAAPAARSVPVTLRCEACTVDEHPALGLLWKPEGGTETIASVETVDWSAGTFAYVAPDGRRIPVQGERTEALDGWSFDVPVGTAGIPFRVVATLDGFSADRAAWISSQADAAAFSLRPVEQVLDSNPTWDPQRTGECEVQVPKSLAAPVTMFVQGQPRAWLYPAAAAPDGTPQWTFQFVKPGDGLLDRVSVIVTGFDQGEAWSFKLPLESLLAGGATFPTADGGVAPEPAGAPADEIRIDGAGTFRLSDCPRSSR
jgi:hypothetical protein